MIDELPDMGYQEIEEEENQVEERESFDYYSQENSVRVTSHWHYHLYDTIEEEQEGQMQYENPNWDNWNHENVEDLSNIMENRRR